MLEGGGLYPAPRVLWVEGKDDQAVVYAFCVAHALPEIFEVQARGGVEPLLNGLGLALRGVPIERLGVVVDANGDADARWSAVAHIARSEGYTDFPDAPDAAGAIIPGSEGSPRLGVWIMPDNGSPGALEDFAAMLVPAGDPLWVRAGEAVDAIPDQDRLFLAGRRSKAHMHTWLAWQEQPGSPMGQAIGKGDLDAHAPAAQRFVAWLRRLMVDEGEGDRAG
ncbi:MAG TPA: DUF3226 domain-containing protein [Longimicrobium sp.]|jgi:hypothetical protein